MESQKYLFQGDLKFGDQYEFSDWLGRIGPQNRSHVIQIDVSIQDIDLRSLLYADTSLEDGRSSPQLLTHDLYETELARLRNALAQLPNVKILTIRALSGRQSFLYRDFLANILNSLSSTYPHLTDLTLEGNLQHQRLSFLGNMDHVQHFTFNGVCADSATEFADTLVKLKHLRHLGLNTKGTTSEPMTPVSSLFTIEKESGASWQTPTSSQSTSNTATSPSPECSHSMSSLSDTLDILDKGMPQSLSIAMSYTPDMNTLESLQTCLERSAIERLELDWPQLRSEVLEDYVFGSGNLKRLWLRVCSIGDVQDILCAILKCQRVNELFSLKTLVLVRHANAYSEANDRKDSGAWDFAEGVPPVSGSSCSLEDA